MENLSLNNRNNDIVNVTQVNKKFGKHEVLKNVSFKLRRGRIIGLVGPNGAGKTTIMKMMLGLFPIDHGKVVIDDSQVTVRSHKVLQQKVGSLIENPAIYPFLTGKQHLELMSKDLDDVQNIINYLKMNSYITKKAKDYSLGMKQKLGIAMALINHPELVILDEPMNGLDPKSIKELRELILKQREKGTTFLISSHILDELERLINDVLIIDKGTILAEMSLEQLKAVKSKDVVVKTSDDLKAKKLLSDNHYMVKNKTSLELDIKNETEFSEVMRLLVLNNIDILEIDRMDNDLESALIYLLNQTAGD